MMSRGEKGKQREKKIWRRGEKKEGGNRERIDGDRCEVISLTQA